MSFVMPHDLLSKPVFSGLGEPIGVVVGVEPYPSGFAHKLWVLEECPVGPSILHTIDEEFVRTVGPTRIDLKGPREGFHITRTSPLAAASAGGASVPGDAAAP